MKCCGPNRDPKLLEHLIALYDSEINYADAHMGDVLERFSLLEDALICVTSDHGEEFLEHGETGHGNNLYEQTIRIPLIMKLPRRFKSTLINQPVSLIDVMPTLLDISGSTPPAAVLGRSFQQKKARFFCSRGK